MLQRPQTLLDLLIGRQGYGRILKVSLYTDCQITTMLRGDCPQATASDVFIRIYDLSKFLIGTVLKAVCVYCNLHKRGFNC